MSDNFKITSGACSDFVIVNAYKLFKVLKKKGTQITCIQIREIEETHTNEPGISPDTDVKEDSHE